MSTERLKIRALTSIRSDYDLLSTLYKRLHADPGVNFGLLVSGAHLAPAQGLTVRQIEADGLPIACRVESLMAADTGSARIKSGAIALMGFVDALQREAPDLIIVNGDREDMLIGAAAGTYLGIPTLHFFGGDHATDGNVDNSARHATSKLSSVHFVSTEEHRQRLLAMGEAPHRVFSMGSPAIDRFVETPVIGKRALLEKLGAASWDRYAVVIFHPTSGEERSAGEQFEALLSALESRGLNAFVSHPNIDAGHDSIVRVIERRKGRPGLHFYHTLPNLDFVNLLRNATVLIGNSSCGIVEAPAVPLSVINVGTRQRGRASAGNVLYCDADSTQIEAALARVDGSEWQQQLASVKSIYGDGQSSATAHRLIKSLDWPSFLRKPEDPLTLRGQA